MKHFFSGRLSALIVLLAYLTGADAIVVGSRAAAGKVAVRERGGRAAAPKDVAACVKFMDRVLERPEVKQRAVERAVDHCAVSKKEDDRNYVCLGFKAALENAFRRHDPEEALTSKAFCEVTEAYMISLRGASRVGNMGNGPLIDFSVAPTCQSAVAENFGGRASVKGDEVPDLWYGVCMNQDCGHYLPSRTRWCEVQEHPAHSAEVCEALRKYAEDSATASTATAMDAKQVCDVYGSFVSEMGTDIEAYEHVVHDDTARRVPKLHGKARALQSSRLLNDAGGHDLRDGAGDPIVKSGAAKAVSAASLVAAGLGVITAAAAFAA
jgi:hypothetical protein